VKQILQNLGNGETILADVPCPRRRRSDSNSNNPHAVFARQLKKMLIDFRQGSLQPPWSEWLSPKVYSNASPEPMPCQPSLNKSDPPASIFIELVEFGKELET